MRRRAFIATFGITALSTGCLRLTADSSTPPSASEGHSTPGRTPSQGQTNARSERDVTTDGDPTTTAPPPEIDWLQYGNTPANTGAITSAVNLETIGDPQRVIRGAKEGSFAVADEQLYAEDSVYTVPIEGNQSRQELSEFGTHMAIANGRLIVTGTGRNGTTGQAAGYNLEDLDTDWSTALEVIDDDRTFPMGPPTVSSALVLQSTGDGRVRALNPADGSTRWRYDLGSQKNLTPALAAGTAVLATDRTITALSETGSVRWQQAITTNTSPVVAHGLVYVYGRHESSSTNKLFAMAIDDGSIQWETAIGSAPPWPGIRAGGIDGETLYVNLAESIFALDRTDGKVRWESEFSGTGEVSVAANAVFAIGKSSSGGAIAGFQPDTGDQLWNVVLRTPLMTEVAIDEAALYLGAGDGLYRMTVGS